jgi:hypothetical protein
MFTRFSTPIYFIVIASLIGLLPSLATARSGQGMPASEFLRLCKVTSDDQNAKERFARCENLIQDTRAALQKDAIKGHKACIPESVKKFRPVVRVIVWLEDHPEKKRTPAKSAVAQALAQSWPCK